MSENKPLSALSSPSVGPPPGRSSSVMSDTGKTRIDLTAVSTGNSPKLSPRSYSRTNSPEFGGTSKDSYPDDDLPTNISTEEQLKTLPDFCLSGNKQRPLRHVNEKGDVSTYHLQPMSYSVIFILLVELLERFSFYGVQYTQTSYLTGAYNHNWNAGMSAVGASSYVSISTAVAYTMPFVGAYLADALMGDYNAILFGALALYLPGLVLILLSTMPFLLGDSFPHGLMSFGLLFLWPTGTGVVKSIVNVFGAKQFHPLLQSSLIESYYVNFYMCINIGALIGGVVVPIMAQHDVTLAYSYPVGMMCIGVTLFLLGTKRYVIQNPGGEMFSKANPKTNADDSAIGLSTVLRISLLIVPFNIAYSQMATTFIVQGTVMKKAFGFIDAPSMNNADAISVLFFGYLVGSYIYPALSSRGIKIPTTYKFAFGSLLGVLAVAWAIFMEYKIRATFEATGEKVNIMWQSLSYILIGCGEIFAVSAAYEAAFNAAPPDSKVLASAVNLFCVGGLPSILCLFLYQGCQGWFQNAHGGTSIHRLEDYVTASVDKYFFVLFVVSVLGVLINVLPVVKKYVENVEDAVQEMVKTPVMKRPSRHRRNASTDYSSDEESPLLRVKRHEAYLKYGSGPVLVKQGSMRAGPMTSAKKKEKKVKKSLLGRLYRIKPKFPSVVVNADGKPMTAGRLRRQDSL